MPFKAYYDGRHARRGRRGVLLFLCLVIFGGGGLLALGLLSRTENDRKIMLEAWEQGAYGDAFHLSAERLEKKPMDIFLLTLHGFSAYELGISQVNNADTLKYIDECIWSLRKALLFRENDGRLQYVLGKAYYYKGEAWAEAAVAFLEAARASGYATEDIPEYLGLSYAALHDYWKSVEAFAQALTPRKSDASDLQSASSDLLLLTIARSYLGLEDNVTAKAYLTQCLSASKDYAVKLGAQMLLGGILADEGNLDGAEAQFKTILEESGELAEVRYQLGEVYALAGDSTRARSEWRRANLLNPAFEPARERLKLNM